MKFGKALDQKKHIERQTNEPLQACQYCGFVSCQKDALANHVRIVHGNGKLNVISQKPPIPKEKPTMLDKVKSTPTVLDSTPTQGMWNFPVLPPFYSI